MHSNVKTQLSLFLLLWWLFVDCVVLLMGGYSPLFTRCWSLQKNK